MGAWYLSLAVSLVLILIGMYVHWSLVLLGFTLPFIPMLSFVLERRAERRRASQSADRSGTGP